jgi:hypothetical protein
LREFDVVRGYISARLHQRAAAPICRYANWATMSMRKYGPALVRLRIVAQ